MSTRDEPDAVNPALIRAEVELVHHLDEACEDADRKDPSQVSMDELLRLEDELLAATRAVRETVRLRRQLGERPATSPESARSTGTGAAPAPEEAPDYRLREFRDAEGKEWRVWEVRPGSSGRPTNPERYLGEYVKGWLAFELLQGDLRKRLPNHPPDWLRMADAELVQLLPRAVDVLKRKPRTGGAEAHEDPARSQTGLPGSTPE
jgi:hypothetical protein